MPELSIDEFSDLIRERFVYNPFTGDIYNRLTKKSAKLIWKDTTSVVRLSSMKINVFSQHMAWFLHHGHWPSNFVCRLDNVEFNDSMSNLVNVTDETYLRHLVLRRGTITNRRGGYETFYYSYENGKEFRPYLGKYKTICDARYRVYLYNVERTRKNRSFLAHIDRDARARV